MKYVRIHKDSGPMWGEVRGETVFCLAHAPYLGLVPTGESLPLRQCRLLAPVEPGKIVCVGKNYRDHALELGNEVPDHPILFLKGPNVLQDPEGAITAPDFVTRVDYEGELAVVMGKRAKNVKAQDAKAYILGYTCFIDVTARIIQSQDGQWTRAKSMDTFGPCGPWVTDEVEPEDLTLTTRLNGKVVQNASTKLLLHSIPELIEFISASMTLEPGDVIATGTPAGIGPMKNGDRVEVEISGIGILSNPVSLPKLKSL